MDLINVAQAGVISSAPTVPQLLLKVLNFLLSIFGVIAIIAVVISGIIYVTAGGDENRIQKAKKMFLYSIVGIIVALGSLVIIQTISKFL
jgi:hypothetical protein